MPNERIKSITSSLKNETAIFMGSISGEFLNTWGDEDYAFRIIYDAYFTRLLLFANNLIKDRGEAQTVVHDALMEVYKHGPFDTEANLKNFVYLTTKNKCIDLYRKKKRRKIFFKKFQLNIELSKEQIEAAQDDAERVYEVRNQMQNLPSEIKKVMMYYYYELLSVEEIAKKEGKSDTTVRNQLKRGKELLRQSGIDKLL